MQRTSGSLLVGVTTKYFVLRSYIKRQARTVTLIAPTSYTVRTTTFIVLSSGSHEISFHSTRWKKQRNCENVITWECYSRYATGILRWPIIFQFGIYIRPLFHIKFDKFLTYLSIIHSNSLDMRNYKYDIVKTFSFYRMFIKRKMLSNVLKKNNKTLLVYRSFIISSCRKRKKNKQKEMRKNVSDIEV